MNDELRECPMCGHEAVYYGDRVSEISLDWRVLCSRCTVMTVPWHSKEAAAKEWNARANDEDAEVGRLLRELQGRLRPGDYIGIHQSGTVDVNGHDIGYGSLVEALREAKAAMKEDECTS